MVVAIRGMATTGTASFAEMVEDAEIPLAALQKLNPPMNLIKVQPVSADFLNSDFKKDGFDSRQHIVFWIRSEKRI